MLEGFPVLLAEDFVLEMEPDALQLGLNLWQG